MSAQTLTFAPPSSLGHARPQPDPVRRSTAATSPVTVRAARPGDLPGLARMLVRCSPSTRLGWYGRGGGVLPLVQQDAWLRRPGSLVVERAPGEVVAVAGLRPAACDGAPDPIAVSVEVVVVDAWQGRGIGGALLRHLAGISLAAGRTEVQGEPGADHHAAAVMLGALAEQVGSRPRPQNHPHGRCLRVHLPGGAGPALESVHGLPQGLRPRHETGVRAPWSMLVPLARTRTPATIS